MEIEDREKKLEEAIRSSLEDGRLPCTKAFLLAQDFKLPRRKVGETCNRLQIKISRCQLGCFE
jgi:hypothetical protein